MPAFLGIGSANPIAWATFYRKGGLRTLAGTAGAYGGIIAVLMVLSARLGSRRDTADVFSGWAAGLLGLQFLFTVVIAAGRVSASVRGDLSSGMTESLRLMPLPAGHAVCGYLGGTAATMSGFFCVNFFLGAIATMLSEVSAQRWLAANLILVTFALLVWTIAAFLAFLVKGAGAVLVIVSLVGLFGDAGLLAVAPGLVVLVGPLIGGSIFNLRSTQTELAGPLVMSVAAQVLVGAIFFAGAARKYRRPDGLALGAWLGLALLAAVVAVSLLAITCADAFRPAFMTRAFRGDVEAKVPFCGSSVLAMLIALTPLANFARGHVNWLRGRTDDPGLKRTVPPPALGGLIVMLAILPMLLVYPEWPLEVLAVVAAYFGFCMSVVFAAAWIYRVIDNAKVILGIWVIGYCLVPLILDLTRGGLSDTDSRAMTMISTFSPVGLLIECADGAAVNFVPGTAFNLLIPLLPLTLYLRTFGRRARSLAGVPGNLSKM